MLQFYYLFDLSIAQPEFASYVCAGDGSNNIEFSPNSAYDTNLNTILSSVSQNMDSFGFYNSSTGQKSDAVSVIAQCRGDVQLQACRDCMTNATRKILEVCPYKKSAIGFYDRCMVRYSNQSIIGIVSTQPRRILYNTANASSTGEFMQDLRNLLESLQSQASRDDLSAQDCFNCLSAGYSSLPTCECYGKRGLRYMMPSCKFQYESSPFFDELPPDAPPPLSPPLPPPPSGKQNLYGIVSHFNS
ncbi:hypothetical protein BC332_04913 [Capsicum chinense]|nr:hypothetical protein BC332_04913 [Capsicum chinense]